jgi:hypothetical protein
MRFEHAEEVACSGQQALEPTEHQDPLVTASARLVHPEWFSNLSEALRNPAA